jgi:hypothetical protein
MANGFKVDNAAGAPGVQPWSRGAIFPLVIARKESYLWVDRSAPIGPDNEPVVSYDVLNADDDMAGFASYDDALEAAKGWLEANKPAPRGWAVVDAGPSFAYEVAVDGAWIPIYAGDIPEYSARGFQVRAVEV